MNHSIRSKTSAFRRHLVPVVAVVAVVQACSSASNEDLFRTGGVGGSLGTGGQAFGRAGAETNTGGVQPFTGQSEGAGPPVQIGGAAGSPGASGEATSSRETGSGGATSPRETGSGGATSPRETGSGGATSPRETGSGGVNSSGGSSGGVSVGGSPSAGSSGIPSSGAAGRSGDEEPELCDALDNDANGIVDDVDEDGDGICDCLRIATIGVPGTWGSGDFLASWLEARAPHATQDALEDQVLTPETLAKYDLVFALNASEKALGRAYTDDEARTLAAWVKSGGGLMTLTGFDDSAEVTNVNILLSAFALHYEAAGILLKAGTVAITEFSAHPISAGVRAVGMDNGHEPRGTGTVYARKDQINIGIAQEFGTGHVDVWADEWVTYSNQWRDHAEYDVPRFWLNTIKWLTRRGFCQVPLP